MRFFKILFWMWIYQFPKVASLWIRNYDYDRIATIIILMWVFMAHNFLGFFITLGGQVFSLPLLNSNFFLPESVTSLSVNKLWIFIGLVPLIFKEKFSWAYNRAYDAATYKVDGI